MIQKGTRIEIVDNTGAQEGKCIEVYKTKIGKIGSKVLLSIKKEKGKKKEWKGKKVGGVIIMTTSIGGGNKAVLIKDIKSEEIELIGSKEEIKIPLIKELERVKGWGKIKEEIEEEI